LADKKPAKIKLPAELETYLPPDLWRKLSKGKSQSKLLLQAHDRLRSLQYLLSTFIPNNLVQEKMRRPIPGLVEGKLLTGSLLFADVSGFTALSERLSVMGPEGAERLTTTMNEYFATMLEILGWSGGILMKFAGDAMLVYFPDQENDQQAQWAVRAGVRMLKAINQFAELETPLGNISLKMKVGVATGEFLSASVGSERRMEYGILGAAISQTMGAEGAATGAGQLIINQATADRLDDSFPLDDQAPGYYHINLDTFEEPGKYEISAEMRRARGTIPIDVRPEALLEQMQEILDQIHALRPYIAEELVERIIAQAQRRRFDSEFLQATVLFCNFVGLDELLDAWGKDGVQRVASLLSDYFSAMNDAISRHGGIVSRIDPYSNGTKLLAMFGAPVSHQDDPLRAVRAALMMNAELEKINQRWSQRFSRHLPEGWEGGWVQHRIGITVGETFAGPVGSSARREYTVMGDDVNLSARLMGASKMGQILISQPVQKDVANYFFLTELSPIKVKGKSQPVPVFQVDGPRADTLLNRVQQRSRLVGRSDELERTEKLLWQAMQGNCVVLTVLGPPGIGKSHLADMVLKKAQSEGVEVISHQSDAYNAHVSYASWSGILRSLAGITSGDPFLLHKEKFQRLIQKLNIADQPASQLANLIGLDFDDLNKKPRGAQDDAVSGDDVFLEIARGKSSRRRGTSLDLLDQLREQKSFETSQMGLRAPTRLNAAQQELLLEALSDLLTTILEKSPLALFFEDAHWMDEASWEIIQRLPEMLKSKPLLILIAQRNDQNRSIIGQSITLEPLNKVATRELVAEVLISDLAEIIHQNSQGNPLFINEIAHWVHQTWQISTPDVISALQSSDVLQNLVLSSLKNLPENQRQLAQTSAVLGEQFRVGELQALLPAAVDSVTLYNDLRALEDARFISLIEAGVDPRYAFQQKLVRDVLYNSLPFARRRELHAQMADYLSSSPSLRSKLHTKISAFLDDSSTGNPAQDSRLIAQHYEAAEMWQLAAKYLLSAADHLKEQAEFDEALDNYQRGLEILGNLPSGKFSSLRKNLSLGSGDTAFLSGDYAQAELNYRAAFEIEDQPDVRRKLALVLPLHGKADEAKELLEASIQASDAEPGLATAATLTWLLWRSGEENTRDWIEKSLESLPPDPEFRATGIEALLLDFCGQWSVAIDKYKNLSIPLGIGLDSIRLGDQYLTEGDGKEAIKQYELSLNVFDELLDKEREPGLALTYYRLAEAEYKLPDRDEAKASTNLDICQELLINCPAGIRKEGRKLVVSALERINAGENDPWPKWSWQEYDDLLRVRLLF